MSEAKWNFPNLIASDDRGFSQWAMDYLTAMDYRGIWGHGGAGAGHIWDQE